MFIHNENEKSSKYKKKTDDEKKSKNGENKEHSFFVRHAI